MKIIQSQFDNTCGLCGDRIEVGQDISPLKRRWYHVECVRGQQEVKAQPTLLDRIMQMDVLESDDLKLAREQYHQYRSSDRPSHTRTPVDSDPPAHADGVRPADRCSHWDRLVQEGP